MNANLSRFFARDGIGQKLDENIKLKYKPSTMSVMLHAWAELRVS
jgi:hypothetical protein